MDPRLLEILACPVCKGPLLFKRDAQLLVCRLDRLAYPIRDSVPVMLEEEARQLAADDRAARALRSATVPGSHSGALRLDPPAGQGAAAACRQAAGAVGI